MSENKLQLIIKDSGLKSTKARRLLENFKDYFDIAEEWEIKAKALIVTNESQTADMQMARIGRLFLREKRIAIEKIRKELKEQSLREGKAIDGIANILKSLIVPIEEHLMKQEKFIEIRDAEIAEQKRIEGERLLQEKEMAKVIAQEKAEAEERKRILKENERLRIEAIEHKRLAKIELLKQEKIREEQRIKAKVKQKALEEKMRIEREKQKKLLIKERKIADAKQKILEEKAKKECEEQERLTLIEFEKKEKIIEKQQLLAEYRRKAFELKAKKEKQERESLLKLIENEIECPFCHKKFKLGEKK